MSRRFEVTIVVSVEVDEDSQIGDADLYNYLLDYAEEVVCDDYIESPYLELEIKELKKGKRYKFNG